MSADVYVICTRRIRPSTGISVLWETEQSKGSFWPINLTGVIFANSPTVETSGKKTAGS